MSWGTKPKRTLAEFTAMPEQEQKALGWAEAGAFVPPDTMALCAWIALSKSGKSPCEALRVYYRMDEKEGGKAC